MISNTGIIRHVLDVNACESIPSRKFSLSLSLSLNSQDLNVWSHSSTSPLAIRYMQRYVLIWKAESIFIWSSLQHQFLGVLSGKKPMPWWASSASLWWTPLLVSTVRRYTLHLKPCYWCLAYEKITKDNRKKIEEIRGNHVLYAILIHVFFFLFFFHFF